MPQFGSPMINSVSLLSTFLFIFLLSDISLCYECDFFNNISVRVPRNNSLTTYKTTVNGCFEPDQVGEMVTGISAVYEDNISYIGDHAVNNLLLLDYLNFMRCHNIENISPRAFENLPALKMLLITHAKITYIPGGTFKNLPSLDFLDLTGNKISEISVDAFGVHPLLEYLIMTGNNIRDINRLWFLHCPNLAYVAFDQNNIQIIKKNTFQFLTNLKQLLLDFNEIRVIEEMSFKHLNDLEVLGLAHNKLVEFDPNILAENFKVQKLYLDANFLNFLPQNLLKKLSVNILKLAGNPWECACLDQIHKWALQENVVLKNDCRTEQIPQCFNGTDPDFCSETKDPENTALFLQNLRELEFWIYGGCANFS